MRRRSNAIAAAAIVGLLLQLVALAGTAQARSVHRATELKPASAVDTTLAPPVKRNPDVVKPERLLRLPSERSAAACVRVAVPDRAAFAAPSSGVSPPRARSHARRLRAPSPDEPPQPVPA